MVPGRRGAASCCPRRHRADHAWWSSGSARAGAWGHQAGQAQVSMPVLGGGRTDWPNPVDVGSAAAVSTGASGTSTTSGSWAGAAWAGSSRTGSAGGRRAPRAGPRRRPAWGPALRDGARARRPARPQQGARRRASRQRRRVRGARAPRPSRPPSSRPWARDVVSHGEAGRPHAGRPHDARARAMAARAPPAARRDVRARPARPDVHRSARGPPDGCRPRRSSHQETAPTETDPGAETGAASSARGVALRRTTVGRIRSSTTEAAFERSSARLARSATSCSTALNRFRTGAPCCCSSASAACSSIPSCLATS